MRATLAKSTARIATANGSTNVPARSSTESGSGNSMRSSTTTRPA
jgi:hypothetical protein